MQQRTRLSRLILRLSCLNTYKMPSDTVFFITDVCIPHSWYTLEFDIKNRLCAQITILSNTSYYIATMNEGVYNGTEFAAELSSASASVVAGVTVVYNSEINSLIIRPTTGYIKIFTDSEIPFINKFSVENGIQWTGYAYSGGEPGRISENIQNFIPSPGAIAYIIVTF